MPSGLFAVHGYPQWVARKCERNELRNISVAPIAGKVKAAGHFSQRFCQDRAFRRACPDLDKIDTRGERQPEKWLLHVPCRPRFTISGLLTAKKNPRRGRSCAAAAAAQRSARNADLPVAPGFLFPAGRETGKRWGNPRRLNAAEQR